MRPSTRLLGPLLLAPLCCNGGGLLSVDIARSTTLQIAAGTVLDELLGDLGLGDLAAIDYAAAQELENQGIEPGDLRHVYLSEFSFEVTAPPGADASFLQSVEVYVSAPDLPTVLIAEAQDFPAGERRIDFDLPDVDLVDYVVSRSMTLSTEVAGSRPPEDTDVRVDLVLDVEATVQGACNAARR